MKLFFLLSFLVAKENEITRKVFTEVGCESVDQDMDTSISSISSCSSKHFNRFYMEGTGLYLPNNRVKSELHISRLGRGGGITSLAIPLVRTVK